MESSNRRPPLREVCPLQIIEIVAARVVERVQLHSVLPPRDWLPDHRLRRHTWRDHAASYSSIRVSAKDLR
jgi:hypothetical protein